MMFVRRVELEYGAKFHLLPIDGSLLPMDVESINVLNPKIPGLHVSICSKLYNI
jgi:hypothetical protein